MDIDLNNMIFRVEDLTMDRVMEEYGFSETDRQRFPDIYKTYVEDFIPTREDLERKIDDAGLKELCLRLPCRVLMHRWNPVQDFIDQFTREGRIQRWTEYKTKKLIVKAVRRHKDVCLYSDVDIRMTREREWCERKKENLMLLELWEYDRNQTARGLQTEDEQTEEEQSEEEQTQAIEKDSEQQHTKTCQLQANDAARTELLNNTPYGSANCVTDDEDAEMTLVISEDNEPIEPIDNISAHGHVSDENANNIAFEKNIIASTVVNVETMMEALHYGPVQSTPSDILPIPPLSQSQSQNVALNLTDLQNNALTAIPNSQLTTKNTEELADREYLEMVQQHNSSVSQAAKLVDYVNINTESLELADSTTISQDVFSDDESTPPYCEFNTHVSMTSTQSPGAQ